MPIWVISASGPIRLAWSGIVFPCLVLNYAGQSAIALLGEPIANNVFFRAVPGAAAHSAGVAGDGRDHHRQPVDHHRRLFHDPAGDPARLAAAPAHHPDLGQGLRPDLCRRRQLAVDGRHRRADPSVPQIRQSRRAPTASRIADHADDVVPAVHRHARDLAMAAYWPAPRCRPVHGGRRRISSPRTR